MTDLESEILEILRMDPETAELLTGMVVLEDGSSPSEEAVREALEALEARGLVRSKEGIASDYRGESVAATWWMLTTKGRRAAIHPTG
jgi:hypothetical protein